MNSFEVLLDHRFLIRYRDINHEHHHHHEHHHDHHHDNHHEHHKFKITKSKPHIFTSKYLASERLETSDEIEDEIEIEDEDTDQINTPIPNVPFIEHIYCLNLESCIERKKSMKKEFKRHQMTAEFIQAIHPNHKEFRRRYFTKRYVDQEWNNVRCFCTVECNHRWRKLRKTEVAISLSHLKVYESITKNRYQWSLVCEDDVIFHKKLDLLLTETIPENFWGEDTEPIIIFLGGGDDNPNLKKSDPADFQLIPLSNGTYSNYAYLINRQAAKVLKNNFFPITKPEDSYKRYIIAKELITSYRIFPSVVGELSSGINLEPQFHRLSKHKVASHLIPRANQTDPNKLIIKPTTQAKPSQSKRKVNYSKYK